MNQQSFGDRAKQPAHISTTLVIVHSALLLGAYMALETRMSSQSIKPPKSDSSEPVKPRVEIVPDNSQQEYNDDAVSEGIEQFNTELKLSPKDVGTYIDRGWSYSQLGKYNEAVADLSHAIKLNPRSEDAWCKRAWVYITVGQYRKALKDANTAIRLNRDNSDALDAREFAVAHLH